MRIKQDGDKYIVSASTNKEDAFLEMLMPALRQAYGTAASTSDLYQATSKPLVGAHLPLQGTGKSTAGQGLL
jgi:hypothetical protein